MCAVQCTPVVGTIHKSVLCPTATHIIEKNCTTSSSKVSIRVCCSICLIYSKCKIISNTELIRQFQVLLTKINESHNDHHISRNSLTVSGESQLFTDYISIRSIPQIITHSTPGIAPAHLYTSLASSSTTKPHCTLSTTCAILYIVMKYITWDLTGP